MKHLLALSLLTLLLASCDVPSGNAHAPCDIFGTWQYTERIVIDGDRSSSQQISGYFTLTNDSRWSRSLVINDTESKGAGLFDVSVDNLTLKGFDQVVREKWGFQVGSVSNASNATGRLMAIDSVGSDGRGVRYLLQSL